MDTSDRRGVRASPARALPSRLAGTLALALAACTPARSADPSTASIPLVARGGATVTLGDLTRDRDVAVVVFWSASCPCVRRYQARVDALLDRFPRDRVRVVGVVSNAGETLDEALRVADSRGVRIPLLRDDGGALARAVGATSTPTVAVLDAHGGLRFLGWLDNEEPEGSADREPWLEEVVDALLAGRDGAVTRTPTYGCTITRSLFGTGVGACTSK